MPTALTVIGSVRWNGRTVVGDRPQALLAALAAARGRTVPVERLVAEVWGEDTPANPAKALQVLVSRVRAACGSEAVVRDGAGYRLGLPVDAVDALVLDRQVDEAVRLLGSDPLAAREAADRALAQVDGSLAVGDGDPGVLAAVRRDAWHNAESARLLRARAASRLGDHAEALPRLEAAHDRHPEDESVLADLLRSEAAVRGAAAALERFEAFRGRLRDRLGTDPGEELQRVHRDLLAQDRPVREGVQYDATSLLGRDEDVRRLHALVGTHRVVSIVGPGGLGKTRLAHVLGRTAEQPVVHFIELVAVTSPEDLVGEVGSMLGVRDSVSGRRILTPQQRADVRARTAQQLDRAPTLLILDNCEHLVAAVADLVAFLVATTRDLHVVTTTRAPLAIAAERVYQLAELDLADAVELFCQRAAAARPGVRLDPGEVAAVVERLDGLPLAIELAAAKVRAMSVADIAHRLANRFALLRGGDRSAPDRHQTLLAVIDWSWNLLAERERRALRRLSVFHDGFTLAAAEAVLGEEALDAVQRLADQSLLVVGEGESGVRYRMLETVREFGRMQLVDAGEDADAGRAHRAWAADYADTHLGDVFGPDQFAAVDAIRAEEGNLADVLRQALGDPDPPTVVRILAALGAYWSVCGEHARILVLADAITGALGGWRPPPELADATRGALAVTLINTLVLGSAGTAPLHELLHELGPGDEPRLAATVAVLEAHDTGGGGEMFVKRLAELAEATDRHLAIVALQWLSHALENTGDVAGAISSAERALALTTADDGPWTAASLHTQLGQLDMQLGRVRTAERHALEALPVLERLHAVDDTVQLRSLVLLAALDAGDVPRAEAELARLEQAGDVEATFGARLVQRLGRAELELARSDVPAGLERYRRGVEEVRELRFPGLPSTGLEPWLLFAESAALTAHAQHGTDEDVAYGEQLFPVLSDRLVRALDASNAFLDYPVTGLALFALGNWGLLRGTLAAGAAVRLLALAARFSYNRTVPTMAWERILPAIERRAPGELARIEEEYGARRGPDLLDEARAVAEELFGPR
ncbi:MAG TPA: BTAD domain-containing putative transcriptional regulator [Marmoricola sp.]|nr:BTAD domain-containing putative transcriptional regulator [Marmoricola sp.]